MCHVFFKPYLGLLCSVFLTDSSMLTASKLDLEKHVYIYNVMQYTYISPELDSCDKNVCGYKCGLINGRSVCDCPWGYSLGTDHHTCIG